jgi:hypothetical protein
MSFQARSKVASSIAKRAGAAFMNLNGVCSNPSLEQTQVEAEMFLALVAAKSVCSAIFFERIRRGRVGVLASMTKLRSPLGLQMPAQAILACESQIADLDAYRFLRKQLGLAPAEIKAIDLDLAVEAGLLKKGSR